jgi:ABC-type multidrug transport system permease subunit
MAQSVTAGSASMPTIIFLIAVAFMVGFYFLNPEGFHHMLDWIARQSNHLMR